MRQLWLGWRHLADDGVVRLVVAPRECPRGGGGQDLELVLGWIVLGQIRFGPEVGRSFCSE